MKFKVFCFIEAFPTDFTGMRLQLRLVTMSKFHVFLW